MYVCSSVALCYCGVLSTQAVSLRKFLDEHFKVLLYICVNIRNEYYL